MTNNILATFYGAGQVALHYLHMVDVVLEHEIVRADLPYDGACLSSMQQVEAWYVTYVNRLDQQRDSRVP